MRRVIMYYYCQAICSSDNFNCDTLYNIHPKLSVQYIVVKLRHKFQVDFEKIYIRVELGVYLKSGKTVIVSFVLKMNLTRVTY